MSTENVSVDTNVLVRGVVRDNVTQANAADRALENASLIALPLPCLCEFVWVLRHVYKFSGTATAMAIQALLYTGNVVVNRPAVEAGLAVLPGGGDFADGVIAFEGRWMGGETFISFDKKAVALIESGRPLRPFTWLKVSCLCPRRRGRCPW